MLRSTMESRRHDSTALKDLVLNVNAGVTCMRALAVLALASLAPVASAETTADLEIRDIIFTNGTPSAYARTRAARNLTSGMILVFDDAAQVWKRLPGDYSDDIAVDPANPKRMVLATGGEVFVSTDGGVTRTRVFPSTEFFDFVELGRDGTRIYAASSSRGRYSYLYRSRDFGATWTPSPAISNEGYYGVQSLFVDPWDANHVLMGATHASMTFDGGDQLLPIGNGVTGIQGVAFSPPGTSGTWAATTAGLYSDSGGVWALSTLTGHVSGAWIDPHDPLVIYAFKPYAPDHVVPELYRSNDGGGHFSLIAIPQGVTEVNVLAFDPVTLGRIVMGGRNGMWQSFDAGATWTPYNREIYDPSSPPPTGAPGASGSRNGGGGAFSWLMLIAFASVWLWRSSRN